MLKYEQFEGKSGDFHVICYIVCNNQITHMYMEALVCRCGHILKVNDPFQT